MLNADVAILGGGPAGSAAAIACARRGLRAVLLERTSRSGPRAGEAFHPGVEPLFEALGVHNHVASAGFARHHGNWTRWDGGATFTPFGKDNRGPWLGFQVSRPEFDAILLARAQELGVNVIRPCRVMWPLVSRGRVQGLLTTTGPIICEFVFDAGGSSSWLARRLTLPVRKYSPPLLVRFGYVAGQCPVRDEAPWLEGDARGWTWTGRLRPGLYHWTRLYFPGTCPPNNWQPEVFSRLRSLGASRGANVTWRAVVPPAGPGYFLLGDAAAMLDPASSHGVLRALLTGLQSAHLVAQIRAGTMGEREGAAWYGRWLAKWIAHDLAELRERYARLPEPPCWVLQSS